MKAFYQENFRPSTEMETGDPSECFLDFIKLKTWLSLGSSSLF